MQNVIFVDGSTIADDSEYYERTEVVGLECIQNDVYMNQLFPIISY